MTTKSISEEVEETAKLMWEGLVKVAANMRGGPMVSLDRVPDDDMLWRDCENLIKQVADLGSEQLLQDEHIVRLETLVREVLPNLEGEWMPRSAKTAWAKRARAELAKPTDRPPVPEPQERWV